MRQLRQTDAEKWYMYHSFCEDLARVQTICSYTANKTRENIFCQIFKHLNLQNPIKN